MRLNLAHRVGSILYRRIAVAAPLVALLALFATAAQPAVAAAPDFAETNAGWTKYADNPVLGGKLGTCFDVCLLKDGSGFRMWFSWRPQRSIALVKSTDGIHWNEPEIALGPNQDSGWEDEVNRPVVIRRGLSPFSASAGSSEQSRTEKKGTVPLSIGSDKYEMWYTGQKSGHSAIGYATSSDGHTWRRAGKEPVLRPDAKWEKVAVMCPHVLWDEQQRLLRMWYSGGEQYEPDAIGYATSRDGSSWTKLPANPIFKSDPSIEWEKHKVTACQVLRQGDWHVMFYIGFRDVNHAQIGVARSRDGVSGWQRLGANPIIRPGADRWDADACYKPFAILEGERWLLWYNGRHGGAEQIGVARHAGADLGF